VSEPLVAPLFFLAPEGLCFAGVGDLESVRDGHVDQGVVKACVRIVRVVIANVSA